MDLTTGKAKEEYSVSIDIEKQNEVEKRVSQYIQGNFCFAVIEVETQEKRLELESKIISTVSLCDECSPLPDWLGLFSPKENKQEWALVGK